MSRRVEYPTPPFPNSMAPMPRRQPAKLPPPCITTRRAKQRLGKGVTPEKAFDLQEGQYPEIAQQISLRGWRRLSKPSTKISKDLVHEFYSNAMKTKEELASGEDYPYTSFVRGKEVDFSAAKIREVLRIRNMNLGAEIDFKTSQVED
ncbi:hypothetical protein PIB30_083420 [Stylosanthes scabra]|uniref:Putative plant transposon protein domain-containing protein n=1 Tax=Stylosanthes scabra TaxID=79078 RepID=A0ABU6STN6_9FABA|nr:hypothetical protein [Stylosanthes scabra]